MDQVVECKQLHARGLGFRAIGRRLGLSRNTVRSYVRDGKVPGTYAVTSRRPAPTRELIVPIVRELLEREVAVGTPRKQRLTGSRVARILAEKHDVCCAETTVRRVVRELRGEQRDPLEGAYLTLQYAPGRDAQVDFFEADVIEVGRGATEVRLVVRTHFLVVRMCYSRKLLVWPTVNQTREALLEGLMAAFEFFGGVPQVLWFDNLTPAVKKVLRGRTRELQQGFAIFQAHFGFQSEFCRPRRGNEKGGVENGVRHVERSALSPMPEIQGRDDLHRLCRSFSIRDAERVPKGCAVSIEKAFEQERAHLLPLPAASFDPSPVTTQRVTNKSWVQHGTNAYSVPVELIGREVQLRVGAETVRIFTDSGLVAEHVREHRQHQLVLKIEHYLPLLERKARAIPHAAVVHQWVAKQDRCWAVLLRVLQEQHGSYDGGVQFVAAIRMCLEHGSDRVTAAVASALGFESVSLATIRYQLGATEEASRTEIAIEYPGPSVRAVSPSVYDSMLGVRHG